MLRCLPLVALLLMLSVSARAQERPVQLAPGARPFTASERLRLRNSQLDILHESRRRLRLGPPVAAVTVTWLVAGAMAGLAFAGSENSYTGATFAVTASLGVTSALGAIASTYWLTRTVRQRRELAREIHRLERQQFGLALGHGQGGLHYTLRF